MSYVPTLDPTVARTATRNRLLHTFDGIFTEETIREYVDHAYTRIEATATVPNFIPLLAERSATQQLRALAKIAGHGTSTTEVLFACGHNSGRSQIAMGFLKQRAPDNIDTWSIGQDPSDNLNPLAIRVMDEVGIDIHRELTNPWTPEILRTANHLITFDSDLRTPEATVATKHLWQTPHISDLSLEEVRRVRDEIEHHVDSLVAQLQQR